MAHNKDSNKQQHQSGAGEHSRPIDENRKSADHSPQRDETKNAKNRGDMHDDRMNKR